MHPPKAPGIAARIEHEIRAGFRPSGTYAPSVRYLMSSEEIASATARKVHDLLRRRGLIISVASQGAIITEPDSWVSSGDHAADGQVDEDSLLV